MFSLSKKSLGPHLCGAYLKFATKEHLDAVKSQAAKVDATFCNLQFPKNSYSDLNYAGKKLIDLHKYNSSASCSRHFKKTGSSALFVQSPYMEHYPEWFLSLISEVNFAYAGYSLNLVDYFPGQYGSPFIKNSKYLLAGSHNEYIGYQKHSNQNSHVLLTGNPLMYNLRERIKLSGSRENPPHILLWAPHWIQEWETSNNGFARWDIALDLIHQFALKNPENLVIFRPHPILRVAIQGYLNPNLKIKNNEVIKTQAKDSFKNLLFRFGLLLNLQNVEMSRESMIEDVLRANYLITEGVSIIGYWATTGKPIVVLRDESSPEFNEDGKTLLSAIAQVGDTDSLREWLKEIHQKERNIPNCDLIEISQTVHPTFQQSPAKIMLENL